MQTSWMKEEESNLFQMRGRLAFVISCSAWTGAQLVLSQEAGAGLHDQKQERARIVFSQRLQEMNSKQLRATLVEVGYAPGESSTPHSHPCPVLVYVL
jgi:hypothetical protein